MGNSTCTREQEAKMENPVYKRLKKTAWKISEFLGVPSFYLEHKQEREISRELLKHNGLIKKCRSCLDLSAMDSVHGIPHAEAVALDAGTVVQVEGSIQSMSKDVIRELVTYVQIAALLHDIKRTEENHTIAGSNEAKRILQDFQIEERYKRYIISAIRNHEAFKEVLASEDEMAQLISDSLYDADKFRWGPDNFTTTLWLLIKSRNMPLRILYENFIMNLRYIDNIKNTFRTLTGKRYGPEFIDMGIIIGQVIYREMAIEVINQ
jgi:hypothetical protein